MDAMKVHAPLLVTPNMGTSSPQDRGLTDLIRWISAATMDPSADRHNTRYIQDDKLLLKGLLRRKACFSVLNHWLEISAKYCSL